MRGTLIILITMLFPISIFIYIAVLFYNHSPIYKPGDYVTFGQAKRCAQVMSNNYPKRYEVRFPNGKIGMLLEREIRPCI